MSSPSKSSISKLLIAIMYNKYPNVVVSELEKKFGRIEEKSEELEFRFTNYYEKEFGKELKKSYLCFEGNFDIEKLPEAKLFCFELEKRASVANRRLVNIDPGYITKNSVVLSSFKERPHRIYLRDGVYADLELVFENNAWAPFKWTFHDLQSENILKFFSIIKERIK